MMDHLEVDRITHEIKLFVESRIETIAAEAIEEARRRVKDKLPELAAEVGVRLQQWFNSKDIDTTLQVLLNMRPGVFNRNL